MNQNGYSLLLSLFFLLSLGGLWLAGTTLNYSAHVSTQTMELSRAKAALVSYAVNYIDHYGPRGAGIGHFPCPDTDEDNVDATHSKQSDPWHRDGPNPPCARQAVEFGWLPRHVNVRDGRYHFHARGRQRLRYAVSGRFVNNPIGRIVNSVTNGDIVVGNFNDVVAILMVPSLELEKISLEHWRGVEHMLEDRAGFAVIRTADIRTQALQRVGGWLVQLLNLAQLQRCQITEGPAGCGLIRRATNACDLSAKNTVFHWLSLKPVNADCENYKQTLATTVTELEGVPVNSHWFIRNEWFEFVEILVHEDCTQRGEMVCQFVLLPIVGKTPNLRVQIQPLSRFSEQ